MSRPFKMKGFPLHAGTSPAKQEKKNLVNLSKHTDYMKVDVSTKEGKDILKRYRETPTISSSEPSRITKPKSKSKSKLTKLAKKGSKLFGGLIGMMLTPKEAGATSTRRDNDITKMYKK